MGKETLRTAVHEDYNPPSTRKQYQVDKRTLSLLKPTDPSIEILLRAHLNRRLQVHSFWPKGCKIYPQCSCCGANSSAAVVFSECYASGGFVMASEFLGMLASFLRPHSLGSWSAQIFLSALNRSDTLSAMCLQEPD